MNDDIPKYALLIGIDHYQNSPKKHLFGCVQDINRVHEFLERQGVKNITRVTAEHDFSRVKDKFPDAETDLEILIKAVENRDLIDLKTGDDVIFPTYHKIVEAFQDLTKKASKGDEIYIHYSGHGARAKTFFEEIHADNGIDECLVPMDIDNDGLYLRDVELTYLVKSLLDNELKVTLVLDSCHSGGMSRGPGRGLDDPMPRSIDYVDEQEREKVSFVSFEELVKTWKSVNGRDSEQEKKSWLPEQSNFVLIAACRSTELAWEYAFNTPKGKVRSGTLTHFYLEALEALPPKSTYEDLYQKLEANIRGFVRKKRDPQTPVLIGDLTRVIGGSERIGRRHSISVYDVSDHKSIKINAGKAGLSIGTRLGIFDPTATFKKSERKAVATVTELIDAAHAVAEIQDASKDIAPGDRAVILPSDELIRTVQLIHRNDLPDKIDQEHVFSAIKKMLSNNDEPRWVALAGEEETDLKVQFDKKGAVEFLNNEDQVFGGMPSDILYSDDGAAEHIVKRLEHITKYLNVHELSNPDANSDLKGKLTLEWDRTSANQDEVLTVQEDDVLNLKIKNRSGQILNAALYALWSDWEIAAFPNPQEHILVLDPVHETEVTVKAGLAEIANQLLQEDRDIFKLFVTRDKQTTSFDWLQLPIMDSDEDPTSRSSKKSGDELDELMSRFTAGKPSASRKSKGATKVTDWMTLQIELKVERKN